MAHPGAPHRPLWAGWQRLPREARDTLFLLGVIGWTILPHVSHLPLWCSVLTGAVLAWRARLALTNAALPGRWVLVAVLLLAAGLTLWSHHTLLGKEPGVTMIVTLMALKTLELRARRDAFVVFFLGFFLVLTHFLYSQSLIVAGAMLVSVWGLLTALVLAHMPVGQPSLRQASALSARTALLGAPIMALLFVLFPRVAPLWGVPQDGLTKSGLAATMKMGSVAEVVLDETIALRIRFDGPVPGPAQMYFRGPVLTNFDGSEWRPALPSSYRDRAAALRNLRTAGPAVPYEMTLEAQRLLTLPLLEASAEAPRSDGLQIIGRADLQWLVDKPVVERLRLRATAHTTFRHGPTAAWPGLGEARALPAGRNPRTLAWAAGLRRNPVYAEASATVLANAVLQHIRSAGFRYTLAPGTYGDEGGTDVVDGFWLDRREGFCEHFAAAFVVVMRAMDVPARVVTGYQGTDPAPVDGYYIVRQSSAHAWAEYWAQGVGWVRADPTAAVAPERIDRGRRLAPPPGLVAGALGGVSPALLAKLREGWEAVNNRWNQWVLNYSRSQQFDALKRLGFDAPSWEDLALLTISAFSSLALAGAAWAAWDRHRIDPWTRQMTRLHRAVQALGLATTGHDTPRALAHRLRERFGAASAPLAELLDALERQRYSRVTRARPDADLTRRFVVLARALQPQPRR
jgi:protein-glutamine gamma-glutamyltransferase